MKPDSLHDLPLAVPAESDARAEGEAAAPAGRSTARLVVVVMTLNEANRIEACLNSAAFAARRVVIDSGSSDDTVERARALGAEVHVHPDWQGFAVQRQRALRYCAGADYLFFLDADEQMTPPLCREISAVMQRGERAAWTVGWHQFAYGRSLHGMDTASGMPRLFHASCLLGFEGPVHERAQLRPGTPIHALRERLPHHSYDSVQTSLKKMSQYAMLGAAKRAARGQRGGVLRGLASASGAFFRFYVLKGGFLGGGAGFLYCYVLAQECFFRYAALHYDRATLTDKVER